jgi:Fe-S cluster assembly protein SufD
VSYLNRITIIGDKQHVDHYTCATCYAKLRKPSGLQAYSLIVQLGLTGNFRRTSSKQMLFKSNNILLSDKATINAKPQLEIFADDVKCSHGCTIGQLDETAMFYMQQRGIPKKEAKALLMYAFSNAVIEASKYQN